MTTTANNFLKFRQSSSNEKKTLVLRSQSTGMIPEWIVFSDNATISLPRTFTNAAGSISKPMTENEVPAEELDELDAEIARMTDEEILAAVLASAGSWADRDDLDFILDRSDRIDELYASKIPDKTDTSI